MGSNDLAPRLLTQLVDQQAKSQPDRLYCVHPTSQDAECEWRPITYQHLSYAVDRVAWWIEEKLQGKERQVLAYIGTNDLRYCAFALACMKTGHVGLLLSTRNSQPAFRHLISETRCSVLVDGSERAQFQKIIDEVDDNCSDLGLERWQMAPFWDIFAPSPVPEYPHQESYDDVEDYLTLIIHSSGTTGMPKPITLTHGYLATIDQMQTLPVPPGREPAMSALRNMGKMRFFHGPMFHIMGLYCLTECIFYETPFLMAPDRPLTPGLFSRIMSAPVPPRWGLLSPFLLQDLWSSEQGRLALLQLQDVNYGGAPLASATGDAISTQLRLQTLMGSSETVYTATLLCQDPADWNFFEWNPSFDHRMEEAGEGLWELVLPRPPSRRYHGVFHSFPHLTEYRTGDLFEPHPSKPDLWRAKGRADDVIVLSNGEKLNPVDAERQLETHPLVHRAAIFGQERFQVALIVEPEWDSLPESWTQESLLRDLAPTLNEANGLLPAHGQVHHTHVTLALPDRPFALTPKGTLRRRETSQLYKEVIGALYKPAPEPGNAVEDLNALPDAGHEELQLWVQRLVAKISGVSAVNPNTDIVNLGVDSLQVVRIAQALQDASNRIRPFHQPAFSWTSAAVYEHATVRRLAEALYKQTGQGSGADTTKGEIPSPANWPREHMLTRAVWQRAQELQLRGKTVMLTGSTGELGSYLLHELLQDPTVMRIYCLNRSADAQARQLVQFQEKRLADGWLQETSRVHFWQADLSQENLGLTSDAYRHLRERVDVVVHNAWMVNFNLPLSSFETQLEGTQRLLALIGGSTRQAALHFISSIAAVSGCRSDAPVTASHITETLHDSSLVLNQGYAESKFAAEVLCDLFAQERQNTIAIHRVGQLAGPSYAEAGMWTSRDWFPALIRTSHTMGELPDSLGSIPVDWVPIDTAARSITQIILARCGVDSLCSAPARHTKVYHIVNPHTSPWDSLAQVASRACNAKIIPLRDWIQSLERRLSDPNMAQTTLQDMPAASLMDFFAALANSQGWVRPPADTSNAQKYSAALRGLGPVDAPLMEVWLRQWKGWIPALHI
ncbi:NRPS-like enzyme [Aspergillus brunneoviolaceus CBS 621.78]|uniref:NRPS-like enzyme n=1 Tax=Aspergillus brunneoviolaceus CBS 621.78 TaxID=1450534 RepID=A0ACD1G194_9EURO|nr:NRPS-like enzyme [Aspergillus brunneoviolaceus CBS 621.78]RAH43033.1 NRPS-like enzyme [Aspergillus brunneoviolaceus CBS 621.78]